MDHAASAQGFFDRISTGDVDQAIELLGDDFVDHEGVAAGAPA
jgi:hypothetical protein